MTTIAGLILAGGKSSRMGQDKVDVALGGKTLLKRAIDGLAPQVTTLAISSNKSHADVGTLPVLEDSIAGHQGPLAGILSGLEWAAKLKPQPTHLAVVPVDAPFFPANLVERLASHASEDAVCVAESAGDAHPVFSLWPVKYAELIHLHFAAGGTRKLMEFIESGHHWIVDFPVDGKSDPFFNINTPKDLKAAERLL